MVAEADSVCEESRRVSATSAAAVKVLRSMRISNPAKSFRSERLLGAVDRAAHAPPDGVGHAQLQ